MKRDGATWSFRALVLAAEACIDGDICGPFRPHGEGAMMDGSWKLIHLLKLIRPHLVPVCSVDVARSR